MKKKTSTRTTSARKTPAKKATTTRTKKPTTRARRKAEPESESGEVKVVTGFVPGHTKADLWTNASPERIITDLQSVSAPDASEDPVKSPNHYTPSPVFEVVDLTNVLNLNGNLAQSLQYIARAGRKGEKGNVNIYCQELEKAIQFLTFELRRVRGEPVSDTLRKFVAWPEK